MSDMEHATDSLTIEFDGRPTDVEVYSPTGWEPIRASPTGCSWESDDGQHTAQHYVDDVKGGTTLLIDDEIVATTLTKREAATKLVGVLD